MGSTESRAPQSVNARLQLAREFADSWLRAFGLTPSKEGVTRGGEIEP